MVYGFVKQSGGHVKIYSEEEKGTTIRIYLPQGGSRGDAEPPPAVAAPIAGRRRNHPGAWRTTRWCAPTSIAQLQSLGYKVAGRVAMRREALAIVGQRRGTFDLLFTDIVMPGRLNGRQLADAMASRRPVAAGAVHVGLHRECHHPSWPAGLRRSAAGQALPETGPCTHASHGPDPGRNPAGRSAA